MIRAWRREDGRYRLDWGGSEFVFLTYPEHGAAMGHLGGVWDSEHKMWAVPESLLVHAPWAGETEKVFGVVTGPSSCGCEPAGFRWVTESEVEAGRTTLKECPECVVSLGSPGPPYVPIFYSCDIIEVLGEPDVARIVYDAEFKSKIESYQIHLRQSTSPSTEW